MPYTSTAPASGRDKPRIMSIVEVFPAPLGPRKAITLSGVDGQRDSPHRLHRAERLMHPPQVDGKRQHGTIPAPRRSTLIIIPGYLHLLARRRGQRPWVVTHPGRLCRATTTGRKSPCASCAMRCSRPPGPPQRPRQSARYSFRYLLAREIAHKRRRVCVGWQPKSGRPARTRRLMDQSAKQALPGSGATLPDTAQTALSRDQHGYGNIRRVTAHATSGHIGLQ
jgi:hypothetical protein